MDFVGLRSVPTRKTQFWLTEDDTEVEIIEEDCSEIMR
jgi:hypothetical protein